MPVTSSSSSSSKATLDAQAGKAFAGSNGTGTIKFSPGFQNSPVLVLTAELKAGGPGTPAHVSIINVSPTEATFAVQPTNAVQAIHWSASEPTG
jgi:hypothetical protein